MSVRSGTLRIALAVVAAGVVGTVANAVARAMGGGIERLSLALVPGRYPVAIAVCAALPVLEHYLSRGRFWLAAIPALAITPSLLAKFVFGSDSPWAAVLGYNTVYALAAIATYRTVAYRVVAGRRPAAAREQG